MTSRKHNLKLMLEDAYNRGYHDGEEVGIASARLQSNAQLAFNRNQRQAAEDIMMYAVKRVAKKHVTPDA